jgi:putative tricarboxylic transport membrane protein
MKFNDAVIGLFFVLFGALLFYVTHDFPPMPGQDYGPDLFPRVIGVVMAFAGAILVAKGLRERRAGAPWAVPFEWMRDGGAISNFLLVVAVLAFYVFVSDRLGFLITGFLCLAALLVWLRGLATWASSGAIALLSVIVIQFFFGQFLRVPLPWGVLQAYAW